MIQQEYAPIVVYERNGVLHIRRRGRERIVQVGEDKEIVERYLNKLHNEHKIEYNH